MILGMVAYTCIKSGYVASQNVEVHCLTPEPLRKQESNTKFEVVLNALDQLDFKKIWVSDQI